MEKLPVEINKKKKKLKNEKLRIASGDLFNSELESKNASKKLQELFAPINYRQTMPDDRFTLAKMNITRSQNYR